MLRRAIPITLVSALGLAAMAPAASAGQTSYTDTSVTGTWTVPAGIEVVQVALQGARGGNGLATGTSSAGTGGLGALIKASLTVTAGEVLDIGLGTPGDDATGSAGGNDGGVSGLGLGSGGAGGDGGFNAYFGGGGGGASAIRIGGSVVLIAAGGGGGGSANDDGAQSPASGGAGGNSGSGVVPLTGSTSRNGSPGGPGSGPSHAEGGGGGTGSAGGAAGDAGSTGGSAGSLYNGGNGGSNLCDGGGGGAGYYGGGGGGGGTDPTENGCGGGGAGSSFMDGTRTSGNYIESNSPVSDAGSAQINYIDFTTTTLATATVGSSYSQSIVATFGAATSPDTWSVTPALPTGLTLNTSTGEITGTPTATSSATYTVTAEVTSVGTVARSTKDFTLTVVAGTPTVSSINPSSGPVAGSTSIQINGSNLGSMTSVTFGGTPATITATTASQLTVTLPTGYGTVDVVVSDGTTSVTAASAFTYDSPTISGVSPTSGPVTGSTSIDVDGTNLLYVNSVTVGGNAATITNVTDSRVTAVVPAFATAGAKNVVVTDQGARSATATGAFTYTAVAPGAPTSASAVAGDTTATVTFSAPASDGGASITSYTVTANPGGATGTGASSPITVTGLMNGVAYTFTVTATNTAGTGNPSGSTSAVTPKAAQTITFGDPGAQVFGTSPTLTATSDSGLTPTFTSSTPAVCTVTTSGTLTFVSAGTCTITAAQSGDSSYLPATDITHSFAVNPVVPGAPTSVAAVAGNAAATVTFTAPASNGGSSITGYTVTASPGGATATGSASPISVTGLTNGVAYTFTVTATNVAGVGVASASSASVTPAASGGGGGNSGGGGSTPITPPTDPQAPSPGAVEPTGSPDPQQAKRPDPEAPTIPDLALPTRIKPKGRTVLIPYRLYTDQGVAVKARATIRIVPKYRSASTGVSPKRPPARIVTKKSGRIVVVAKGRSPFVVRLVLRAPSTTGGPAYSTRHVWRVPAAKPR